MLGHAALREFAELTFANEIDLALHSDTFRRNYGPAIATMFSRWRGIVSDAAYDVFVEILGLMLGTTEVST